MGGLLAQSLRNSGILVTISDFRAVTGSSVFADGYIECDVRLPSPALKSALRSSDCVCICLPEAATVDAVASVLPLMSNGSLWVDTVSVKSPLTLELQKRVGEYEILSINPMFAPALGWNKRSVAAVEICSGPKTRAFCALMASWGAQVENLTAIEHDQLTAAIQVATHAAILAFGHALIHLNFDITKAVRLATPPHRLLLTVLHRLASQNSDVYWDIQACHPLATVVRDKLADGIARLSRAPGADGQEQFRKLFDQIESVLQSEVNALHEWSQELFTAPKT
ncbi:MAG: prephenate dehydrogenase dimerization domain-containing protein [Bryobacteraceae bacterium]